MHGVTVLWLHGTSAVTAGPPGPGFIYYQIYQLGTGGHTQKAKPV